LKEQKPLIIDVKRHALDDGPGIRTTIFFKGCPLRCVWCHNPETIDPNLEIGFYPADCIQCGECAKACPTGAVQLDLPGRIDRTKCNRCGKCADACPGRGLRRIGRFYEINELVDIIRRDQVYYQVSGGGVTLSGGEPTLHMNYASQLLRELKTGGIHTAIETSGLFAWSTFKHRMLDWLDLVLFDLKLADPELHNRYTGQRNDVILQNMAHLARERPGDIIVRIPLIPGITAERENLQKLYAIIRNTGIKRYSLLPYNPLGLSKRITIGKPMVDLPQHTLTDDEIRQLEYIFSPLEMVEM
jgi:pyruvate formate lyase activating enzyme